MTGLRFSQEVMSHDQSYLLETDDIEMLLNKRSDAEEDVSDGALEQVRRYLEKVCGTSQEVNHELLQRVFKCLQVWALSPALSKLLEIGFVPLLATMFDNFIQSDYSRPEVLASILELLFVVEDMSDSNEGKIKCGELFLFRLLALATTSTKLPSVRLQRAAVETTCALVTRSPENQLAVLNEKVECNKLFKSFLPRCGDFQLQASVTEIFYRLLKKGPQLIDLVHDEAVRKSIQLLMQSKSPDLLSEIRTIVTLLNESLGHARSVYSFPAERILINGLCITTTDNWVNFGRARLSFFTLGLPDSDVDEPSIMDLQYEDIVEHKRSSPTLLEILLRPDIGGLSPFKAVSLESGPSTVVRAQFFFSAADLSNVEANVFPKIRAVLVARQGKLTSNYSATIDKSTREGPKRGPSNFKAVDATNMNSHLRNGVSPTRDGRLPEQGESRGLVEKTSFDFMHISPDFVSQTPQDLGVLEGVTTQDYARSKRTKDLSGITSDRPKSSKPPGRESKGSDSQLVGPVPSTGSERCNPHLAAGQPFRRSQEVHLLQNNTMGSVDAHPNMSLRRPIDGQADVNQSHRAAIPAKDSNKSNHRTSKPSRLETQNLQDLSGPKTKSPADATLSAQLIEIDDETTDETHNCERVGELRMKKRQDSHPINVVPLELTHHVDNKNRLVGYTSRQLSNAELQETQRFNVSLEKNLVTSPRDVMGSDSVMTDIREKHVTSRQTSKTCRQKTSRAVPNGATGQVENGAKTASRTLSKRKCKKTTSYFDADDDLTSAASHDSTSTECILVTRQKKSRINMETDQIINKNAKHTAKSSAQTMAKCGARASIPEKSKTADQRNRPPNKQPCLQKPSTIVPMPVSRKQSYSTSRQASHAATVKMCASSSRKDVQDVYCFTANLPEKQELPRKTSLELSCKARRNSDYGQPYKKRRPAGESQYNMQRVLYDPRQRSCISEGPRPKVPARPLARTSKSPPRASPAGSASPKQDEVTPEQPGAKNAGTSSFSRSSDSEGNSRSPILRTQKTYTKSDKIITKDARRERWKSFSIRKLQFPTVDATFHDEFSDDATPGSSPHAKVFEVGDLSPDSEDRSGIDMIEKLLKSFKQKVKLVEKKKVGGILSNAMQRIDREIQSAEEQVRGEKTEFLDACNKKCGKLDSQLQEQIKKMREMYDKFRQDFAQHLELHDNIVGEIEEAESEINDLAKQQGQNHKDIFTKLKESCKNHLADADQKIRVVGKSSTGMLGLKDALQGILKDL